MTGKKLKTNRAPVLTLWAAVVAERLGHDQDAALGLGKAVAGLNAQSKGRRLGIFEEAKPTEGGEAKGSRKPAPGESTTVTLLGRSVPAIHTDKGLRATVKGQPVEPDSVRRYLAKKFGEDLGAVQSAMEALAQAYPPEKLAAQAYDLYEKFRPQIPEGKKGWGAAGELDLDYIRSLAQEK